MKKIFLTVISILLVISLLSAPITASAAQVSATTSATGTFSFLQQIIDFFNSLINAIRNLLGISTETGIKPISPVVNNTADVVVNFGAYGDGIHDDTKAIQNALDYMESNGGTIYFPDGVYMISACLIFYSDQELVFSDNAVLKRMKSSEPAKYMLATYTTSSTGEYNGVQNSKIVGGTFDGNSAVASNLTIINLCHAKNVTISDAEFVNGSYWHYIEMASSKNIIVTDCSFDSTSYTLYRPELIDELIQLDVAKSGNYGPIYNVDGKLVNYAKDEVPCVDIRINNNIFNCSNGPAIGEHNGYAHSDIFIYDNIFNGVAGTAKASNGYIKFMSGAYDIEIYNNTFNSSAEEATVNKGILSSNTSTDTIKAYNNVFTGYFSQYFSNNIVAENNIFE